MGIRIRTALAVVVAACGWAAALVMTPQAAEAAGTPGFLLQSVAWPTNLNSGDSQNTMDRLTIEAQGGKYALRVRYEPGATVAERLSGMTEAIEWDESAAGLQAKLEALEIVGKGSDLVTGGTGGSASYTIEWVGALSGQAVTLAGAKLELTGGAEKPLTVESLQAGEASDRYRIMATNVGGAATSGPITITDQLPEGVTAVKPELIESAVEGGKNEKGTCELKLPPVAHEVQCRWSGPLAGGGASQAGEMLMIVEVAVESSHSVQGSVENHVTVSGGGALDASTTSSNPVNVRSAPFGVGEFAVQLLNEDGTPDLQAGGRPWALASIVALNTDVNPQVEKSGVGRAPVKAPEEAKSVAVDLPAGLIGDPLASERCREVDLGTAGCLVGYVSLQHFSNELAEGRILSNIVPERGYPGELATASGRIGAGQFIPLYASVVRTPQGYRLQIATPGVVREEPDYISVVVFGRPGVINGTSSDQAFLTNPTGCTSEPQTAQVYVTSWHGTEAFKETTVYPSLTGCNLLTGTASFSPTLELEPEESHADTPSGYQVTLKVPQAPNVFGQVATPDLKNATVTLPQGVSLSPAAASGPNALVGCAATGPEGINVGSNHVEPDGQDLGDPEATERGEGHPGSGKYEHSPYDDGLWHTAPGHCPAKSQIGTVEVKTPLLEEPLKGHVYVAQPGCGGSGQPECTPASAEDGQLYGIYLEMGSFKESGTIIKLKGKVSVNATTGQITTTFSENPQLPFEELKLNLSGGQRSALANPQTCGTYTTTSDLEPWSAPESGPNATPSWPFEVTGCTGAMAFKPGFEAGTTSTQARGSGAFTMTLTRNDGEQDVGGVSLTMPEGAAGLISKVTRCAEAQANAGTCPASSRIGTTHVAAGAGSEPLWLEGPVYLTGPYRGDPFGLSVVVPAKAGPYNLGNEVVRAGISVDPHNGQVTIASEPLRLIRDGVPFRIKELNVTVDKQGFIFNPTNCSQLAVTGTVSGDMPDGKPGATVAVSNPFAVTGCKGLRFKPSFKAETHRFHSRKKGAFLRVRIGSGEEQANLAKVHVTLPKAMPSELSTLKMACTEAQFAANPAGCPKAAFVGNVVVHTPVLSEPLRGPAIFVSHASKKFPTLNFVLQGEGVTIIQEGETNIHKGFTSSSFNSIPDLPVKSIVVTLPEREKPALAGNGNFCKKKLTMPTTITGQNGAVIEKNTKIKVKGCKASKTKKKERKGKNGKQGAAKRGTKGAAKRSGSHLGVFAKREGASSGSRARS